MLFSLSHRAVFGSSGSEPLTLAYLALKGQSGRGPLARDLCRPIFPPREADIPKSQSLVGRIHAGIETVRGFEMLLLRRANRVRPYAGYCRNPFLKVLGRSLLTRSYAQGPSEVGLPALVKLCISPFPPRANKRLFVSLLCSSRQLEITLRISSRDMETRLRIFPPSPSAPYRGLSNLLINLASVVSRHQRQRLTYEDLDLKSNALARGLAAGGVTKGDRVAVSLGNSIEYAIV